MRKSYVSIAVLVLIGAGTYAFTSTEGGRQFVTRFTEPSTSGGGQTATASDAESNAGRRIRTVPVEVAAAREETARLELHSVATLASDEAVNLAAELAGRIADIRFDEGTQVRRGDVLIQLDDALARAEFSDSEARLRLAEANYERANSLSRSGIGTQRARDEAIANLETARAVHELAKVRLDKTSIRAPFDGIVGLRTASVGAYVQAGQTIVNLEKIDRLKVDFRLPEIHLANVKGGQTVLTHIDALPGKIFEGEIYAIDPMLDVNGRALRVRARLQNADGVLRPGLFARITVQAAERGSVIVVPESAILPRAGESYVFRVVEGRAVETRVELGQRRRGEIEILSGVDGGDTVVVSGHDRMQDGAAIEIVGRLPTS